MKYLHYSAVSIAQHGSMTIASMKNQCVYIQTRNIYASEKKKAFRLLDLPACQILAPSAACTLKQL